MQCPSNNGTMLTNTCCSEGSLGMHNHGQHPLRRVEKLNDLWHIEALLEPVPHIRPHPVAVHAAEPVVSLPWVRRRHKQVPRCLADVDEHGGLRVMDIVPKG